jgi:mono/diheme cytochrome c family protein
MRLRSPTNLLALFVFGAAISGISGCGVTPFQAMQKRSNGSPIESAIQGDGECNPSETFKTRVLEPVAKPKCAGCHGAGQSFQFAVADAAASYAVAKNLIDLSTPESSTLVVRAKTPHTCPSSLCNEETGAAMLAGVEAWVSEEVRCASSSDSTSSASSSTSSSSGGSSSGEKACSGTNLALFQSKVKPMLQSSCIACHGGGTPSAKLGFDLSGSTDAALCVSAYNKIDNKTSTVSSKLIDYPSRNGAGHTPNQALAPTATRDMWVEWANAAVLLGL